jgi:hypothetical protein
LASHTTEPLTQTDGETTSKVELTPELMTTLSFIDRGCLPNLIDGKTAFIFKIPQEKIDSLKVIKNILFGLECIKRPEFPSVRMYFSLIDKKSKPHRFDYFFSIESDEDMELLQRLKDQDYLDMIFFSDKIECLKRVKISKTDKEKIRSVTDEARG